MKTKLEDAMYKFKESLRFAALALVLFLSGSATLAQLPPDNVAGNWTIYSRNIDDGVMVTKFVQIVQNGSELTGYFQGPNQSGGITGHVDIHHIEFSTETRNVLTFRGEIDGNSISGMYGLHGQHAEWSAVREGVTETVTVSVAPAPTPAPAPSDQLNSLVAPIALYPDALVAQVLAAATFPEQVAAADMWMTQNSSLTGAAQMQAIDQQTWDASVKALTQFPAVLHELASNLAWTSNLGQAFQTQQPDVMAAVQTMRARAQTAGTLQSNPQVTVTQQSPSTIVIQPANPTTVYVPQYNPTVVYGAPVVVPMYTPPVGVAAGISFGAGVAVGAAISGGGGFAAGGVVVGGGGGFAWGWHSWGCNWGGGGGGSTIIYNHNTYIHNNTWNNNNNHWNGYHPWGPGPHGDGPYGPHPYTPNGGHNGDHGLIGGNGGVQHQVPNGGHNGDHGLIGGNGGVQHQVPDGGHNGDHGLIGGNGGVQHPTGDSGDRPDTQHNTLSGATQHPDRNQTQTQRPDQRGSRMSGDGGANRTESNRGRSSISRPRPQQHVARPHPQHVSHPAPHASAPHRR
jgi:hypothetical protein